MSIVRRRSLLNLGGTSPVGNSLLEQGALNFNYCNVVIDGRAFHCWLYPGNVSDAYNVKRYCNVTDFAANVNTGTGQTADISNKHSGFVIPAGAVCTLAASDLWGHVAASYSYVAVILRDTGTGDIKRIGAGGNNNPTATVTWTQATDVEIGCVAVEFSHMRGSSDNGAGNNTRKFTLSLTVNGEEWL